MKYLVIGMFSFLALYWASAIIACVSLGANLRRHEKERRGRTWYRCSWHDGEFWFTREGDHSSVKPAHVTRAQTSHGICRDCLTRMQSAQNHDCVNAPVPKPERFSSTADEHR